MLVHGIGVSSRYLVPVGRELASRFRVLAPDLPGFGRSGRPPDVPGVRGLADWLRSFLDAAGVHRPHALANSMGCQIVLDLAAREPEALDRLVRVGPPVEATARTVRRKSARLALDRVREPPSLLPIIALDYLAFGPRRLFVTGVDALRDRPEENAARVTTSTLVLRGERDALLSRAWSEHLARVLPNGRHEEVRTHAHAVHFSAPDVVARRASAFLLGEEAE